MNGSIGLTKEEIHLIPRRSLLLTISKHNHVDGRLEVAKTHSRQGDGELGVDLEGIEHAGETGVCGHLEGDCGCGEEGAGALVDGGVEGS